MPPPRRPRCARALTCPTGNFRMRAMRKLPVVPICRRCQRLLRRANHNDALGHPASMKRDVSADRHDTWGGDAMDAEGTSDERGLRRTAKSCGPGAPKQALRSRDPSCERRWQPSKGHRGEHDINRKTIAQGMPVADSIGRRNTSDMEVAMSIRKKRST